MNETPRLGIRGRLFLAFGALSALTLLASSTGWISNNQLGDELDTVVEENILALGLMADLKEQGATITNMSPTLMVAKDDGTRQQIRGDLIKNLKEMDGLLPRLSDVTKSRAAETVLSSQVGILKTTLAELDANVQQRLRIENEKLSENQRLRWVASGFLSDIDSLIENVQQNLRSRFNQDLPNSGIVTNNFGDNAITTISADLQILYRIKADVNLLINLVDRAQHLPDLSSLIATKIHSEEIITRINTDLHLVDELYGVQGLKQTVVNIVFLTKGDNNMFTIRREERVIVEAGKSLIEQIRSDLKLLNQLIGEQVGQTELAAQAAARNARHTIQKGQVWMISMVGASLLFSIFIVWFYVGRNMVARITRLDDCMRSIADGNLDEDVPVEGRDEIGAMARSLLSFRNQLTDMQEELVQAGKLAALGQLSAGIAHEINQPLSAIGHYSHNGLRLIKLGRLHDTEKNLNQISNLTKRATTIITRLKSLARKQEENLVVVDLDTVVENVLSMFEGDEVRKIATVELNFEQEQNEVLADPVQLEQVVLNLFTNALDAIADSPEKLIEINCCHKKSTIEIQVRDSGPGIDAELRGHIFEPFFTTKRIGQNLGLGLSISYNIIKNFGGKLIADNHYESGASFCIRLPKYQRSLQ
ncbi:MAG: HAMP domain-containing protein [Ketobacter sp.]|nr:HAMP domain-containing protein [Ketobacter sp.]